MEPLGVFKRYLREHDLRLTAARRLVADTVFSTQEHFTVKQLLGKVRRRDPSIGLATVYRTLALLVRSGLIAEREFQKGRSHYEQTAGARHHDHLLCNVCGDVVEFADEDIEELQRLVASRHGFQMTSHVLKIMGLCPHCQGMGKKLGRPSWDRMRSRTKDAASIRK